MNGDRHSTDYWKGIRGEGRVDDSPPPVVFIGVDGEGTEEKEGQRYSLLSSSLKNPITNRNGLGTEQCIRYLLSLKVSSDNRTQLVAFGFSYDLNMILKDVYWPELVGLYHDDECWFKGKKGEYHLRVIPGHQLTITEYTIQEVFHEPSERVRSVTVWDTYGFFQGRFLRAVQDWKIPLTSEEQTVLEGGKEGRGGFLWKDLQTIIRYNHLECDLLVRLMERVQEMLRGMGLYLSRWDGAGAVAASLMKKHNLKRHVNRGFHPDIEDGLMRAYFGGRSQCLQFGRFKGPIYHYDINSAYPSSYLDLPTLHGRWETTDRYILDQSVGLYQLEWDIPGGGLLTPFPYRDNQGNIRYPHQGRGIYHASLVSEAMKKWRGHINIERGWIFTPDTDDKPFGFVKPFMEERLRLKREGDLRHITMKLGANSIYGKTAQSVTFGDDLPPYQSYLWAGMITSWTHTQLLRAGIQEPNHIIFYGTDSVFSLKPLSLLLGISLGTWEDCGELLSFDLYQPGLYRMKFLNEDGEEEYQGKTRGFHSEEVSFDSLGELWEREKYAGVFPAEVIRFQAYQMAVSQTNRSDWRTWKRFTKEIHLRPGGWGEPIDPDRRTFEDRGMLRETYRYAYIEGGKTLSARFTKTDLTLPEPRSLVLAEWQANIGLE